MIEVTNPLVIARATLVFKLMQPVTAANHQFECLPKTILGRMHDYIVSEVLATGGHLISDPSVKIIKYIMYAYDQVSSGQYVKMTDDEATALRDLKMIFELAQKQPAKV